MSLEALCYFGLLRARESLERILTMMPEERRQNARTVIESCAGLPDTELRKRLEALLRTEAAESRGSLPPGINLGLASPAVRRWLEWRFGRLHERQDHQG